jgi:hypothetical protein
MLRWHTADTKNRCTKLDFREVFHPGRLFSFRQPGIPFLVKP